MAGRLRSHLAGPLAPFTAGFAAELGAQGYTPNSVRQHLRLMTHLSQWLAGEGLELPFDATAVDQFLMARRSAGYVNYRTAKALRPLLNYLRCLDVIPASSVPPPSGPVESMLDAYRRYLMHERGVRSTTARG